MKYKEYYEARDMIEDFLIKDLFGPVEENEIIEEDPLSYYALGMLSPQEMIGEELETENEELDDVQEAYDENISLSNSYNPSSMAITTTLARNVKEIKINITSGRYDSIEKEIEYTTVIDNEGNTEIKTKKEFTWKRIPIKWSDTFIINEKISKQNKKVIEGFEIEFFIQKIFSNGEKLITVALVNKNKSNTSLKINNEKSFFQCNIELSATNENEEIFIERRMKLNLNEDEELKNFEMLYSHVKNYALGHGCSVQWNEGLNGAYKVYSTFMPKYELKQMMPAINVDSSILRMKFLAEGAKLDIYNALYEIVKSYTSWIEQQEQEILNIPSRFNDCAMKNLEKCKETKKRIKDAIEILGSDDTAFKAFQFANRAMLNQRVKFLEKEKKTVNFDTITWYPFQLAFILQQIKSMVDPKSQYRDVVDLLWFPTGGGKTEAYLGLSAFTIFLRRLRRKDSFSGVTIIMRYTLRLLTIQQFERAAALICACELIRKQEKLGGMEISIGLWVGSGLTPNSLKDAEDNLKKLRNDDYVTEGNPVQILKCPWCGEDLDINNYSIEKEKMLIRCGNTECEFSRDKGNQLPIYLVDEDIYNNKPTLIVSTVDKFARMAWEPRVGEIFGLRTENAPPELIIQDELHLISGPLGTITGLYEIAINKFCEEKGIKAKVIASTATIRNAENQILSLFGKDFSQFPPQGVNMRDSYFAEESTIEDKPSRKYIGVLSTTKTPVTALIRVYASLLFASRYLIDLGYKDEVIDNYWTLVGYFNSLRELGGAVIQVLDDVQDRYKFLYATKYKDIVKDFTTIKRQDRFEELTSRKKNSEISEIIQKKLKVKYPSRDTFDFILASNMISVGVDVGRLGLMAVTGQPKTNSEYIQATSRVGRENPGLVVTIYNRAHSRDRSHYEQFLTYHSAMYKFVESTSITPFSDRARDRALHGVYISLCRQLIEELRNNEDAKNFNEVLSEVKNVEDYISNVARKIDPQEYDNILAELQEIREVWSQLAQDSLVYKKIKKTTDYPLLKSDSDEVGEFATLNSMRNVDVASNLFFEED